MADRSAPLCRETATIDGQVWACSLDAGHPEDLHRSYGVGWRGEKRPHEVRWTTPRLCGEELEFSPEAIAAAFAAAQRTGPSRVRARR